MATFASAILLIVNQLIGFDGQRTTRRWTPTQRTIVLDLVKNKTNNFSKRVKRSLFRMNKQKPNKSTCKFAGGFFLPQQNCWSSGTDTFVSLCHRKAAASP